VLVPTRAFSAWASSADLPAESESLGPEFGWALLSKRSPGAAPPDYLPFSFSKTDAIFLRAHGFAMAAYTVGVASLLTVVPFFITLQPRVE